MGTCSRKPLDKATLWKTCFSFSSLSSLHIDLLFTYSAGLELPPHPWIYVFKFYCLPLICNFLLGLYSHFWVGEDDWLNFHYYLYTSLWGQAKPQATGKPLDWLALYQMFTLVPSDMPRDRIIRHITWPLRAHVPRDFPRKWQV